MASDLIEDAKRRFGDRIDEIDVAIGEAKTRLNALQAERLEIDTALNAMSGAKPVASSGGRQLKPRIDIHRQPRKSVRTAVEETLLANRQVFNPTSMLREVEATGYDFGVSNLQNSVRTALWQLRDSGVAVSAGDSGTIHSEHEDLLQVQQTIQNAENPA